jgi:formylglycine-generating enzyme required for sulfatase activity
VCGLDADADGEVRRTDGGRDCDDTDPASYTTDVDADCDGLPVELDVMELIAAGSFDMGCTPGQASCDSYEYPIMPVTLTRAFYVGRTEVTQAEYEALMGYNPSYFACPSGDCPVERVSWHEAAAYANAASASAGLTSCYACVGTGTDVVCSSSSNPYACTGYRLPTEAEWEYAARCGTDLRYAGSDDLSAVAWWYNNAYDGSYPGPRPHGVGQLSANACGVYDMSGNVSEWVEDHWDPVLYSADGRTNPLGVSLDELHAYRGGCAWSLEPGARVARRDAAGSSERYEMLGFRLARTAP